MSTAPEQVEAPQGVLAGYDVHVPKPSHTPVNPQVACGSVGQSGWGRPAATGVQDPLDPTRLHEMQAPWHEELQQTPSPETPLFGGQLPDAHSSPF
jgi:hypothetical protein